MRTHEPAPSHDEPAIHLSREELEDMPVVEPIPVEPSPRPPRRQAGKGGSQHRYVQHLNKRLAEEHGFLAVVEEAVAGGSVDVGLHRGDLSYRL